MRLGMNTQKDVAKAAGVSLKTVSRVMNDEEGVKPETKAKVRQLMSELGYQPSVAAQLMRSKSSNIVGFIANRVATSYSSIDLIRGAQDMAWELGRRMMLVSTTGTSEDQKQAEAELAQFRADTVIYATIAHQEVSLDPSPQRRILLNCFQQTPSCPTFVPDDYGMARSLTATIIERGYRRPLFLNLSEDHVGARLRRAGFVDEAQARGLDFSGQVIAGLVRVGDGHRQCVDEVLPSLLAKGDPPDLILCGQDQLAMQVYAQLALAGLRVGQDVGVASFDNQTPIADNISPGLSTMALPYYEMGRLAMQTACQDAPLSAEIIRVPSVLVERGSF